MNSSVVEIDLVEKESVATYLLPDGTEKDHFSFTMNVDGYKAFSEKIPKDVRIVFEASGSAYTVDRSLRNLGYSYSIPKIKYKPSQVKSGNIRNAILRNWIFEP